MRNLDWRADIEGALSDFSKVARLAGDDQAAVEFQVEYLEAPHQPTELPTDTKAVYSFWGDGEWLKIGKAGPKTGPRFRYQHYNPGSASSTLAASIVSCKQINSRHSIPRDQVGDWIKANTHRCNIFMKDSQPDTMHSLLEVFLHHRLKPRYEGKSRV